MKNRIKAENAQSAIRSLDCVTWVTLTELWKSQTLPRTNKWVLKEDFLDHAVRAGTVEVLHIRGRTYYRGRKAGSSLATTSARRYTSYQQIEYSLTANVDWLFQALGPLRQGKAVKLWMNPAIATSVKKQRTQSKRLVVVTPGTALGLPATSALVSVVGAGSCIVQSNLKRSYADLVLAKMPASLAKPLMNAIHRVLEE